MVKIRGEELGGRMVTDTAKRQRRRSFEGEEKQRLKIWRGANENRQGRAGK